MPAAPLSPTPGEKITRIFSKFDGNGDGVLSRSEFSLALRTLDPEFFTEETIERLFDAADANHNSLVEYPEFVSWLTKEPLTVQSRIVEDSPGRLSQEDADSIQKFCAEWDEDDDGAISKYELSKAVKSVMPEVSSEEIDALIESADLNMDGCIQYCEFIRWMRLPSDERLTFEDNLRQFVSGAIRSSSSRSLATSSSSVVDTPTDEQLNVFNDQLLSRFSVVNERADASRESGSVVVDLANDLYSHRSRYGRSGGGHHHGAREGTLRRLGGAFKLEVTAPSLETSGPSANSSTAGKFRVQSDSSTFIQLGLAYSGILQTFCDALGTEDGPAETATLRLQPVHVTDKYSTQVPLSPALTWAAIAIALQRLAPRLRERLEKASVQLCVPPFSTDDDEAEYAAVLRAKLQESTKALQPLGEGVLPDGESGFAWVRRDQGDIARFRRLQTFALTQRATELGSYEIQGVPVALSSVEPMVARTFIQTAQKRLVTVDSTVVEATLEPLEPAPAGKTTLLQTVDELGHGKLSVMTAAQLLAKQDKAVVAVNAASAYQCGGGVTGGGRHALEEAWCTTSTLFRSLQTLDSVDVKSSDQRQYKQHIPTDGCVVSPDVEIFRMPTDEGYGFMEQPVHLCGVLSIAMFNRNARVSDSPLDSPEDPAKYLQQVKAKLEALIVASVQLGAEVLCMPDVGCGVFQNDSRLVGGCLGVLLKKYDGYLTTVVITCKDEEFFQACQRAFSGQDPRADRGDAAADVEACLLDVAKNPREPKMPECRYGLACTIRAKDHRQRFSHPPKACIPAKPSLPERPPSRPSAGPVKPSEAPLPSPAAATANPNAATEVLAEAEPDIPWTSPAPAAAAPAPTTTAEPAESPSGKPSAGKANPRKKRVCKYGEKCYSSNPQHFEDFAHPWLDPGGEPADDKKARTNLEAAHEALNLVKNRQWDELQDLLRRHPEAVNIRPAPRDYGLIHFAAYQGNVKELKTLAKKWGADLNLKTGKGQSVEEVLQEQLDEIRAVANRTEKVRQAEEDVRLAIRFVKSQKSGQPDSGRIGSDRLPAVGRTTDHHVSPSARGARPQSGQRRGQSPGAGTRLPDLGGHQAGSSGDARTRPNHFVTCPAKVHGKTIRLAYCLSHGLNGQYEELQETLNDHPVWRKPADHTGLTYFLYRSSSDQHGWVVDIDCADRRKPLLYNNSLYGRWPYDPPFSSFWNRLPEKGFASLHSMYVPDRQAAFSLRQW
eukprot:TRINITY_DN18340_c0_g2_i1.p1 TRINITY_DN18340_c0_g2~~TRINITY_DN18340_c0_g2_i1.p1  ORF type:complete len:1229 (-),score=254.41 TRINITY_DN18340_c0_g2_i1:182-3868(-)